MRGMGMWVHEHCGGEIFRWSDEDGEFWECDICQKFYDSEDSFNQVKVEDEVSQLAYISMNKPVDSRQRKP